jgi:poly(3-hydroxybutyrate) depolymerase
LKSGTATIDVGGMSRQYTIKVPDNYDANHAYRLIFSFHWLNGTMQNVANGSGTAKAYYGLWGLANGSTIFVAPQGINNGWSDSGRSTTTGGQDIAFTKALYDKITSSLCIDTTRVFAEGFSMGGSMSYALACALPDLFRAVAVHSGGPMTGCVQHSKPVAYFMTHGINDGVCTYPRYGVPQLNDFAKVNGCMSATLPTPSSAQASCIDFSGCMPGFPARGCTFVGDHTPSPPNVNGTWVPAETWKFLSQF